MTLKRAHAVWFGAMSAMIACTIGAAHAMEVLYAASVRSPVSGEARTTAGSLYRVDVATGAVQLIAPIRVGGSVPIGVTGLADHPTTGLVYGITSEMSPNYPRSLVTIDLANGQATLVGELGAPGSDIAFDPAGNLFVWLRETGQLGLIDIATGAVSPVGAPRPGSQTGGLAIDAKGRAYVASTGASGTLDRVDPNTGAITHGPQLLAAPYPGGINSLTVSSDGVIFAVNTNLGAPANTLLVRIDPASGRIAPVGPMPNETDALLFIEPPWKPLDLLASRGTLTLVVALLVAGVVFLLLRPKRGV